MLLGAGRWEPHTPTRARALALANPLQIIADIPDAKEMGLSHLCEFIEDCEFTYLSVQVRAR